MPAKAKKSKLGLSKRPAGKTVRLNIKLVPELRDPLFSLLNHAEANGMIFSGYRPQIRQALEKHCGDLNKATVGAVESVLEISNSIEMPDSAEKVKAWAVKERKKLGV